MPSPPSDIWSHVAACLDPVEALRWMQADKTAYSHPDHKAYVFEALSRDPASLGRIASSLFVWGPDPHGWETAVLAAAPGPALLQASASVYVPLGKGTWAHCSILCGACSAGNAEVAEIALQHRPEGMAQLPPSALAQAAFFACLGRHFPLAQMVLRGCSEKEAVLPRLGALVSLHDPEALGLCLERTDLSLPDLAFADAFATGSVGLVREYCRRVAPPFPRVLGPNDVHFAKACKENPPLAEWFAEWFSQRGAHKLLLSVARYWERVFPDAEAVWPPGRLDELLWSLVAFTPPGRHYSGGRSRRDLRKLLCEGICGSPLHRDRLRRGWAGDLAGAWDRARMLPPRP